MTLEMNDLSMHILDIVQNSISAGATRVSLTVDENPAADLLTIVIGDNGRGMTPEQVSRLSDALMITASSNPRMDFLFTYRYNGEEYVLDTADVKEIFGEDAFSNLTIVKNIEEMLKENIEEVRNS